MVQFIPRQKTKGNSDITLQNLGRLLDGVIASRKKSTSQKNLADGVGLVAAENITAQIPVPNFANSAVDGYGLSSKMVKKILAGNLKNHITLPLLATIPAGRPPRKNLSLKNFLGAILIYTGGVLPKTIDMVLMREDVLEKNDSITLDKKILQKIKKGDNVRKMGDDVAQGQVLIKKGDIMTPLHVGLLLAQGIKKITCYEKPTIGVFSIGDEVISQNNPPKKIMRGMVRDSNRPVLLALLTDWGYGVIDGGVLPDDKKLIEQQLYLMAKKTDVIITSGGMAVGGADYSFQLIQKMMKKNKGLGFTRVAIKPGRPLGFSKIGNSHWFATPGNPVAVMMVMFFIIKPFLKKLMGDDQRPPPPTHMISDFTMTKKKGRIEFIRVKKIKKGKDGRVVKIAKTGSAVLSSLVAANGIIALDEKTTLLKKGDRVIFYDMKNLLAP